MKRCPAGGGVLALSVLLKLQPGRSADVALPLQAAGQDPELLFFLQETRTRSLVVECDS